MFRSSRIFIAAVAFLPAFAFAQESIKVQRLAFRDGRATVRGSVTGYSSTDYVFPAGAGESIRAKLKTSKAYFNLLAPGSTDEAFFVGSTSGNSYEGVAPTSGDYKARVYLMRNEARRGTSARYTLTIAVGTTRATDEKGPDFADGLTGGPDYWEVKGVPAGDTLKVRATPSPKGKLVTQVGNSAVMKNQGCKLTRGQRWCRVEDGSGRFGWVNGKYLREAAWPPR
ncbi:MAG: DNA breaking-rejoining protein [Methylocystis sp.]|nr:MAG: DNA breaking-rejoining protein [Methylocystis sp.]